MVRVAPSILPCPTLRKSRTKAILRIQSVILYDRNTQAPLILIQQVSASDYKSNSKVSPIFSFVTLSRKLTLIATVIQPPRVAKVTMSTLSIEEVSIFLDAAKDTTYYVFFATLLYTGLRKGELLALRWRNLDLASASLMVVATAYRLGNGECYQGAQDAS
jgi:integrase